MRPLFLTAIILFSLPALAEPTVTTRPLGELQNTVETSAPATVLALNSPSLAAQLTARVDAILVRVGDTVTADQPLVRLDCREFESRLAASEAQLEQLAAERSFAAHQWQRARTLKKQNNISDETLEQRRRDLTSLDARIRAQRQQRVQAAILVDHCTLHAPFAAVVTERLASVGDLAAPGTPLVTLTQLDDLEISAQLQGVEAERLSDASGLWFDYQGQRHALKLRKVLPVVNRQNRSHEVRLSLVDGSPPAGAAGRLIWRSRQPQIQAQYLVRRKQALGLFLHRDGRAVFHPLAKAVEGQPASVSLPPDTAVIVQGRHGLRDGDAVRLAAPAPSESNR